MSYPTEGRLVSTGRYAAAFHGPARHHFSLPKSNLNDGEKACLLTKDGKVLRDLHPERTELCVNRADF
jgi:hypothetical protein